MKKEELQFYEEQYFSLDLDVPFTTKDGLEIKISPIRIIDSKEYDIAKQILLINQILTNDIEAIQMSYLEFLLKKICLDNEAFQMQLSYILGKCCGLDYFMLYDNDGKVFVNDHNRVCIAILEEKDGEYDVVGSITDTDFDKIRSIILHQNDINYDDRRLDPHIQEIVNKYFAIKHKNDYTPNFEQRRTYIMLKYGLKPDEVNNLTCRLFDNMFSTACSMDGYLTNKILQSSEKYEFKEEINHPLFTKPTDYLDEVFSTQESVENKLQSVT